MINNRSLARHVVHHCTDVFYLAQSPWQQGRLDVTNPSQSWTMIGLDSIHGVIDPDNLIMDFLSLLTHVSMHSAILLGYNIAMIMNEESGHLLSVCPIRIKHMEKEQIHAHSHGM